jgi:alcohol dehydrogenase
MQLFQQQYHIFGSFGAAKRNIASAMARMADGVLPVIDTEYTLETFQDGLARLEHRDVFGKILVAI